MEIMWSHIEKLLIRNDFVVIPDLGGFVVQTEPANLLTHKISAPRAVIAFNPLMTHIDGLLALEMAKSMNISYREATNIISDNIGKLKFELNLKKRVQLGKLGTFEKLESGSLVFTPTNKPTYLIQNLGITDIYLFEKDQKSNRIPHKPFFSYNRFKYVASIIFILGLLFVSPGVMDKRSNNTADLSSIFRNNSLNIPIPNSTIVADTCFTDTVKALTTENQENFHVIVATFSSEETAQAYCTELNLKDHKAHIISSRNAHRVAIESFYKFDEAVTFMEDLRKSEPTFESAWVYCKQVTN